MNHWYLPPAPSKAAFFSATHPVSGKGAPRHLRKVYRSTALLRLRLHQMNFCRCFEFSFWRLLLRRRVALKRVSNSELPSFQVHVPPPKCKSFALAKTEGN